MTIRAALLASAFALASAACSSAPTTTSESTEADTLATVGEALSAVGTPGTTSTLTLTLANGAAIPGESTDGTTIPAIPIQSWQWEVSNNTTIGSASGGAGAGKASLTSFQLATAAGAQTPEILKLVTSGQHAQKAVLTVVKTTAGKSSTLFVLTMGLVAFTDQKLNDDATDGVTEQDTLAIGSMFIQYNKPGTKAGSTTPVSTGWSAVTNSPCDATSCTANPG